MKKTVITCMLLQKMHTALYSALQPEIHVNSNYDEAIYFPINALMANQLQENDQLTVIILKFNDDMNPTNEKNFQANYQIFQNEMNKINETIGAKIEYKIIETDFVETNDVFAERFLNIFNILEQDCTIYTDITFGPKTATLLIMNLLSFAENFYNAFSVYVLAENEYDGVVGFGGMQIIFDEAHIMNIAVKNDFRRKGIADGMLCFMMSYAKEKGAAKMFLEVRRGNLPAQALYLKHGFNVLTVRKNYYSDNGEDAIIMTAEL